MKTYVLVGAGLRALEMYAKPLMHDFADVAKIVGIFDINIVRAEYVRDNTDQSIPIFDNYEQMMLITQPDVVIITTIDSTHYEFIVKSLDYGSDVITEKPITIDADHCYEVINAEQRTKKEVVVAFNCRYKPNTTKIKELILEGILGDIHSVNFEWFLDTSHGAEYYRRWHRDVDKSGGLLVHKSTHHFDLINWWLDDYPTDVFANGTRSFYGHNRHQIGDRCLNCNFYNSCDFRFSKENYKKFSEMYFKAESLDGYIRDKCVFGKDISILDNMSLTARYNKGAILTYSLISFSPYEGWKVSITGTEGRLEATEYLSGKYSSSDFNEIKVFKKYLTSNKEEIIKYNIPKVQGKHGGADKELREVIFREKYKVDFKDPLFQYSDTVSGAKSLILGLSANKSIKENMPINMEDFINKLTLMKSTKSSLN